MDCEYQALAEVLDKNVREQWPQILADYFKVELSLVETICEAYNEIDPERFKELVYQIPEEKSNFYQPYFNGQQLVSSEEEILKAYEIEETLNKNLL